MSKSSALLNEYISRSMNSIQGYLTALDARIVAALLSYQDENNIAGNLCEIGVHHGRLFLLLALARRAGERALAIDLFEDDSINSNTPHAGRNGALFANARRLGIKLSDEEILKSSSLCITADDILARTAGPIRFFSVDGSHLYPGVENDLRLAELTLTGNGIIAVDDFFNTNWADVSWATFDFLRKTEAIVPFAITSKLYLAPAAMAGKYKETLSKCADLSGISSVQILSRDVLALRESIAERAWNMLRDRISLRAF